jgi:hypothetical protein
MEGGNISILLHAPAALLLETFPGTHWTRSCGGKVSRVLVTVLTELSIRLAIMFTKMLVSRMFENRVLWRIFGLKRDEVTGGWRKLHNELRNMYPSPSTRVGTLIVATIYLQLRNIIRM